VGDDLTTSDIITRLKIGATLLDEEVNNDAYIRRLLPPAEICLAAVKELESLQARCVAYEETIRQLTAELNKTR